MFLLSTISYIAVSFSDPGVITESLDSQANSCNKNADLGSQPFSIDSKPIKIPDSSCTSRDQEIKSNDCVDKYNSHSPSQKSVMKAPTLDIVSHTFIGQSIKISNVLNEVDEIEGPKSSRDSRSQAVCDDNTIIEYDIKETMENEQNISKNMEQTKSYYNESNSFEGRYCMDCHIDLPLRAKHCIDCGFCVATFDHHCSWVANCVGERNKMKFFLFLVLTLSLLFLKISMLFFQIKISEKGMTYLASNIITLIAILIGLLLVMFVWTLLKFQLFLAWKNQTTWENYSWHKIPYIRDTTHSQKSPFDKGFSVNIKYILCYKATLKKYNSSYIPWKKLMELE